MRKWKKVCAALCAVMLMLTGVLTGCSKKVEIDPEKTVDAAMKLVLQGDAADYVELSGEDAEEVEAEYNEVLAEFEKEFTELGLSDEFAGDYAEAIKKMLASGKYEILGSSKDEDDNYVVDVAVYPSDIFKIVIEKAMKEMMASLGTVSTEEEVLTLAENAMIAAMDEAIEEQTYGEAQTYQLHLTHDEDYVYDFDENEISEIMAAMFPAPDSLMQPTGTDYGNQYLNWTPSDWQAASDEEQTMCCLAIVQSMYGFTDEQMAMIDVTDATVQQGVQEIKDGLDMAFDGGLNLSVGDYVTFIMNSGFAELIE